MNKTKKLVHTAHLNVRWSDLDVFGHVNNTKYFTYFEESRWQWWQTLGLNHTHSKTGPVVVNAFCDFFKAITEPTELIIKLYADQPGNSSCKLHYEIFQANIANKPVATGYTVVVWVDYQAQKSVPLPDSMRTLLI